MSDFNDPGVGGGDQIAWADVNGALLLFDVHGIERGIETKHGISDAVKADVAVLDGENKGQRYEGILIFPKILRSQTEGSVGGKVLGRLGQGANKKGNPPWQLETATEAEKDTARKYLAYIAANPPVAAAAEEESPF